MSVRYARSAALALGAIVVASCSSVVGTATTPESTTPEPAPVRPTLTDPKIQPPDQDNKYTRSTGRPHVVFDPCTWFMPDDVASIGYDERSRKRGIDLVAEYSFLSCRFQTPEFTTTLRINSGNVTWDEDQQKNGSWLQNTEVNGRQAAHGQDPATSKAGSPTCEIHMRTRVGVVFVTQSLSTLGEKRGIDSCTNLDHIASVVEKSIGKEN
ncbi:DUF3558 domain-containing protein [Nocardia camponoti]|uniref:DUF3558 domain-containing protein n=1 Tax=Nocardia camponoti TaxID=1616106 RepID=A0A917QS26_9NOCA|nr:DUF3558 domain-containing protein [Nocardia camponoti]GGK65611.1 hypothetical protein GCM10011591_42240 [Nocardia camponoti]